VFEYAVVSYGGRRAYADYMIWADRAELTLQHALLEHGHGVALYIYHQSGDPPVTVQYVTFRNNGTGVRVAP
jgi:hypothetical protein